MSRFTYLLLPVLLAGCGAAGDRFLTMRQDTLSLESPQPFAIHDERQLTREAIALEEALRDLIRTAKKPACTQTDDSCGEAKGLLGRLSHKGPVDPVAIQPGLADTHARMDSIATGTTQLLDAQTSEKAQLLADHQAGHVSDRALRARLTEMEQARVAVADALSLSITQAERARRVLEKARANGQAGLGWYAESLRAVETRAAVVQDRLTRATDDA